MVPDASDDDGNDKDDGKSDNKDKPERTDDEVLLFSGDGVVEIDGLGDFENAKGREIINATIDVADGFWEDDFFEFVGIGTGGKDDITI